MASNNTNIRDPEGGANQSGLRDQNARVVLSFIRRHGEMASAEIARRAGLSAQTVSIIIRGLEADGLLKRGKSVKGKVGKPSVPMALNPNGVFSLGLNIGRRSAELVMVDFNGKHIDAQSTSYPFPDIDEVFAFLRTGIKTIFESHPGARNLVTGIGVARPNRLWDWLEVVNAPEQAMQKWRNLDFAQAVSEATGLEAFVENDATSACVAEHLIGRGSEFSDFAYIFVGAFVGSGLVLNGKVFSGRTGNAAALGPLPVPDGKGGTTQLLKIASLHVLESALINAGKDPNALRDQSSDWHELEKYVSPWIEETSRYLAIASASIASVVEVEAILIDGAMPEEIRQRLTVRVRWNFANLDLTGIEKPQIEPGSIGRSARSIGAALLPIHSRYFLA